MFRNRRLNPHGKSDKQMHQEQAVTEMKQQTFSDIENSSRKRKAKRKELLDIMNDIIPWDEWVAMIQPLYFNGKRGRPPRGIEAMLLMYLVQALFNLSDEGVEDAIYDSYALRKFVGIDFLSEQVPDATTLLHFFHLLEVIISARNVRGVQALHGRDDRYLLST